MTDFSDKDYFNLYRRVLEYNLKSFIGIYPIRYKIYYGDNILEAKFISGLLKDKKIKFPFKEEKDFLFCFYKELQGYLEIGLPPEGSAVIHAGAYPGDLAILLSDVVGNKGRTIALEPNSENRVYVEKIVNLNKSKVYILPLGLSNRCGKDVLILEKNKSVFKGIHQKCIKDCQTEEIQIITIDALIDKLNLLNQPEIPIFFYMDIEGAEVKAMEGARKTLERGNVAFAIASYHIIDGEQANITLRKMFDKKYYIFDVYPRHLTTVIISDK